jgi:hypothetical protein
MSDKMKSTKAADQISPEVQAELDKIMANFRAALAGIDAEEEARTAAYLASGRPERRSRRGTAQDRRAEVRALAHLSSGGAL